MKSRKGKPHTTARAIGSLTLIAAFLLLGSCPVRNVIFRLVQLEHAKKAQPAPEHGRFTAGQECSTAVVVKSIPATGRLIRQLLPAAALTETTAFSLDNALSRVIDAVQPGIAIWSSSIPLYLRNRALLI